MNRSAIIARGCEMYAFHGQLGLERADFDRGCAVRDVAHLAAWSSNKLFSITAGSFAEMDALMAQAEHFFAGHDYRHVVLDPLTPPAVAAYLALHDYTEHAVTLQMILSADTPLERTHPMLQLNPVHNDDDWSLLQRLVREDHIEGARTQGVSLSAAATQGIVRGYRAKAGPCQFFIGSIEGQACSYGAAVIGPNGMGMVEDVFTAPVFRRQGIASAIIAHCVAYTRQRGASQVLIGSHVNEAPKHLYRTLGFAPSFVTREYIRHF